eukprot:gene38577-46895_t
MLRILVLLLVLILSTAFTVPRALARPSTKIAVKVGPGAIHTIIGEDEPLDSAVKRFRRQVRNSGHLMDMRYKEHWETAQAKKKRKAENARRQNKYERMNDRFERKRLGLGDYV